MDSSEFVFSVEIALLAALPADLAKKHRGE